MTTLNISVSQARVANVAGKEVAKYFIIGDSCDLAYIVSSKDADDWNPDYGFHVVTEVNVEMPVIVSGSREEIESDILSIIKDEAVKENICSLNECGTLFIK